MISFIMANHILLPIKENQRKREVHYILINNLQVTCPIHLKWVLKVTFWCLKVNRKLMVIPEKLHFLVIWIPNPKLYWKKRNHNILVVMKLQMENKSIQGKWATTLIQLEDKLNQEKLATTMNKIKIII